MRRREGGTREGKLQRSNNVVVAVLCVRYAARLNYPRTTVVALPCCPGFRPTRDLGRKPDFDYDDYNIFSDKRHIDVWTWEAGGGGGEEVVVLCGEVGEGG